MHFLSTLWHEQRTVLQAKSADDRFLNLSASVSCRECQQHWIILTVRLDKCIFKAFTKSSIHNSSFWRSNLWAHWLCHPDKCNPEGVLFFSATSSYLVHGIEHAAKKSISSLSSLKKMLQWISIFQPSSHFRLFSKIILSSVSFLFLPSLHSHFPPGDL